MVTVEDVYRTEIAVKEAQGRRAQLAALILEERRKLTVSEENYVSLMRSAEATKQGISLLRASVREFEARVEATNRLEAGLRRRLEQMNRELDAARRAYHGPEGYEARRRVGMYR